MALFDGVAILGSQYAYGAGGPFDVKMLVSKYSDMTSVDYWKAPDGSFLAYNGMIVAVNKDRDNPANNGVYFLHNGERNNNNLKGSYDSEAADADKSLSIANPKNWHKLCSLDDLASINTQLSTVQSSMPVFVTNSNDLPSAEDAVEGKIYVVTSEAKTYIWHDNKYMPVGDGNSGSTGGGSDFDFTLIHGGSASKVGD